MDIQQLRTFVEVVQRGSFAAAARVLDMAPSAVTRSVAALEEELGVRLMQRTTRQLSLTEAGSTYFEQVIGILEGLDRAGDDAGPRPARCAVRCASRLRWPTARRCSFRCWRSCTSFTRAWSSSFC